VDAEVEEEEERSLRRLSLLTGWGTERWRREEKEAIECTY
jgi:hypothetical protein